jgi:hypothetical protein
MLELQKQTLALAAFILILPVLHAQSSTAQTPSSQTPQNEAPEIQKTKKVWTNDDLGRSNDANSAIGESVTGPPSPRSFSSNGISIVSPAAGTVVAPGETFSIEVSVDSGSDVGKMFVMGPMGHSEIIRDSPPYSFPYTVPRDGTGISEGFIGERPIYVNTSSRFSKSGPEDASTVVDVEVPGLPVKLAAQWPALMFESVGESASLEMVATFPNGSVWDVDESTRIAYRSSDPNVATVNSFGVVTSSGRGRATINVTYTFEGSTVELNLPASCRCDSPTTGDARQ